MTPTIGAWYRVWQQRYIGDCDAGGYVEGQLDGISDDSDECWLIGDDGEEIVTRLSALEEVP
jgi:hypothetical protein